VSSPPARAASTAAIASSPLVPDGTSSVALCGWLDTGQEFGAQILIPDLAPENTRAQHLLLRLYVRDPHQYG
jgi:hypothetical protein